MSMQDLTVIARFGEDDMLVFDGQDMKDYLEGERNRDLRMLMVMLEDAVIQVRNELQRRHLS